MNIQIDELQKLISKSQNINGNLNIELNNMKNKLEEICNNINSNELTASNQNLRLSIEELSNKVQNNLPKIIDFLNSQVKSYQVNVEAAKKQLDTLVSEVNNNI